MTSAIAVLVRAKARLIDHGWQRRRLGNDGPCCLDGAVRAQVFNYETTDRAIYHEALRLLYRALGVLGGRLSDLWFWNDFRARDRKAVLRLIDRAIDIEVGARPRPHISDRRRP